MEEKGTCNISYTRQLVEQTMRDNRENKEEAYEIFRGQCISFFKRFGSVCECQECKDLVIYILKKFIVENAYRASLEFEAPLISTYFKIGDKVIELNIKLRDTEEPPLS